jgi:hypothetical protein
MTFLLSRAARAARAARLALACAGAGLLFPAGAHAQTKAAPAPAIEGTWRVDAASVTGKGPREVIIRADSSASWGKETVRWRLPESGKLMIALGGEWETYRMKLKGDKLTLSGGDLSEPILLKRTGPSTPRPDGVPIPPDPDTE